MTGEMAPGSTRRGARGFGSGVMSFVDRHPVMSYLVVAFAIFWAAWMPVLFFGAPPRLFSAVGGDLGHGPAGVPHHCCHGRPSGGA